MFCALAPVFRGEGWGDGLWCSHLLPRPLFPEYGAYRGEPSALAAGLEALVDHDNYS